MSLRKSIFKTAYKTHIYVGIFVAFHFAVLSITGFALLFRDEIQKRVSSTTETPKTFRFDPLKNGALYDTALRAITEKFPTDRPLALYPDETASELLHIRSGKDGATVLRGSRRLVFDLSAAKLLNGPPKKTTGFFDGVLTLHRELFLGSNGKIYIGVVGAAYVFMLISGFFIYGRFMKTRRFGEIRRGQIPKLVDWHKFLGVVTFGWAFIVGLSGVFLAFNGVLIKYFQFQSLKHLSEQYKNIKNAGTSLVPLSRVIRTALETRAESVVSYVSFPNTEFGVEGHYLILVNGTQGLTQRISELIVVDAYSGALSQVVELPSYLKLVLLSEPLHFGGYGGIFLKIVWAFFTLGSLAVVFFGVFSFFAKRRKRVEPVFAGPGPVDSRRVLVRCRTAYFLPILMGILSIMGICGALFLNGLASKLAMGLILIPPGIFWSARLKSRREGQLNV